MGFQEFQCFQDIAKVDRFVLINGFDSGDPFGFYLVGADMGIQDAGLGMNFNNILNATIKQAVVCKDFDGINR